MTTAHPHKVLVARLLDELAAAAPGDVEQVLRRHCHPDAVWEVFHPFNTLTGIEAAAQGFWRPLKESFPDYGHRLGMIIAGQYRGGSWVSTLGHVLGSFAEPWVGIPPTHRPCFLRLGLQVRLEDDLVREAYVLLDVVDVMRQAGHYPFRAMPGTPEQWPMPPVSPSPDPFGTDPESGKRNLASVMEMQEELGFGDDLFDIEHSPRWHKNMNWYGPSGIGSTRGQRGFDDHHGALFVQAFPDAAVYVPETGGFAREAEQLIEVGDGPYVVTCGWPSLIATHSGAGFLGQVPSHQVITMRVADWYRADNDGLLIDNWVMIDLLDVLSQTGYDVLDDLSYLVDPTKPRWPPPRP